MIDLSPKKINELFSEMAKNLPVEEEFVFRSYKKWN